MSSVLNNSSSAHVHWPESSTGKPSPRVEGGRWKPTGDPLELVTAILGDLAADYEAEGVTPQPAPLETEAETPAAAEPINFPKDDSRRMEEPPRPSTVEHSAPPEPTIEVMETPSDTADRGGTGLWALAERGLATADRGALGVLANLAGEEPDAVSVMALTAEIAQVMHETRIQALVMEVKRTQTSYAITQAGVLQRDATLELMANIVNIKRMEKEFAWAETPEEKAEVAEQSAQLRANAREQFFRTLETGLRRIDEQVDRALHPAHPDFPQRSDPGQRPLLAKFFAALRGSGE